MSDERMIRVELENGRGIFANSSDQINVYMEDTEPVAPKDWRPSCYQADGCPEAVDDWTRGIGYPNCPDCPYRKKRE